MRSALIYEPKLGLDGTIPELVDKANRYTNDYSDEALERISYLAKMYGMTEAEVAIPKLLIGERARENKEGHNIPYERMKIDWYLNQKFGYSYSDGEGGETDIWNEDDRVVVSLQGIDDNGSYVAVGTCSVEDFLAGEENYLDNFIGSILYYAKIYRDEEEVA